MKRVGFRQGGARVRRGKAMAIIRLNEEKARMMGRANGLRDAEAALLYQRKTILSDKIFINI